MIEEEIREALDVDPSPEFLARVRTRIATEPAPSRWRPSWTIAAAAALAVTVVIAFTASLSQRTTVSAPDVVQPFRPAQSAPEPRESRRRSETPVAQQRAQPQRRPRLSRPAQPESLEAEILLDTTETRALRNLIAGVRAGRVDLTAVHRSVPLAPMEPPPVVDIDIAPIAIAPIAPPSGAEGARQ
jgi:hypothetical protein